MTTINILPEGTKGAYTAYGGCHEFLKSRDRQIFLYGSTGSGKTFAGSTKMLLYCLQWPGCKFLFTRNSYSALIGSGVETFEKVLKLHGWELGRRSHQIRKIGESKPTEYIFPYARREGKDINGNPRIYEGNSRIILASLDNAQNQLGAEYDFVYVNQPEQSEEEDWHYVCSRADGRNNCAPFTQIWGDPNPKGSQHWIKKFGYELEVCKNCDHRHMDNPCHECQCENFESQTEGRWRLIRSTYHDNPVVWNHKAKSTCEWSGVPGAFTPEGGKRVEESLKSYSAIMAKRLVFAEWANYEGLVYTENWDRKRHVISTVKLNEKYPDWQNWDTYWGIDFGFDDPFVLTILSKHPEKELYINTKTIYMTNRTIIEHVETIKNITIGSKPPKVIVADRNPESIMILQQALGMNIISAKKGPGSIKTRINVITNMLKNDELLFLDDAIVEIDPRLQKDKKPLGFIDEVEVIQWRDNTELVNDMPKDGNDHQENSLGYILCYLKAEQRKIPLVWI